MLGTHSSTVFGGQTIAAQSRVPAIDTNLVSIYPWIIMDWATHQRTDFLWSLA